MNESQYIIKDKRSSTCGNIQSGGYEDVRIFGFEVRAISARRSG